MTNTRTSKAVKGTITSFMQYGLQIVLQAILMPLIVKVAGSEILGAYAILMQVIGYGILLDLGFGVSLSRYLAQSFGFDDGGKRFVDVFNSGRMFYLLSNIIFGLLIFIFSFWVNTFLRVDAAIYNQAKLALYFYGVWIIIRTPVSIYQHALNASQNMALVNLISILGNAIRLISSLVLIIMKTGLVGLVLANIIADAVTFFLNYLYFNKKFPQYRVGWGISNWPLFKEMHHFGLKYYGVNIASIFFYGMDNLIIGYLFGAGAAAIYYLTRMPVYLSFQLIFKLSDNAFPAANELFAKGDLEALRKAYFRILRYSVILIIPFAIGIISLNKMLISVWVNPSQYAGDLITVLIAVFAVAQVIGHIDAMIVVVSGKIKGWSTLSIVMGVIQFPLAFLLGKVLGLQGVVIATVLTSLPGAVFLFLRSIHVLEISFAGLWDRVYRQCLAVCIPIAGLTILIKMINPPVTWFSFLGFCIVYASVWAIGVNKIFINIDERELAVTFIKSKLSVN